MYNVQRKPKYSIYRVIIITIFKLFIYKNIYLYLNIK